MFRAGLLGAGLLRAGQLRAGLLRAGLLLVAVFCVGLLAAASPARAVGPEPASGWLETGEVSAKRHMVVAANPVAAAVGLQVLRDGGSAVDAAIATVLALGVVEPQSSGLGGGAFMVALDAKAHAVRTYDGRETAPAAITAEHFLINGEPPKSFGAFMRAVVGGQSVGVPGLVRMLAMAHAAHGRLPWRRLVEPAARLAREGFVVTRRLQVVSLAFAAYLKGSTAEALYLPGGAPPLPGTRLLNPALAEVLDAVADSPDALYEGPIARDLSAAVRAAGGLMTEADLAAYRPVARDPVVSTYRKHRVYGMGPPSSGGLAVAQLLGVLERLPRGGAAVDRAHRFVEASGLAFADRERWVGDPQFTDVPPGLLAKPYVDARAKLVAQHAAKVGAWDPGRPPGLPPGVAPKGMAPEWRATTHLNVVDDAGNAVAMTASIENAWGSMVLARGVLMNNQLTDFAFLPNATPARGHPNRVAPGKRPRSSMSPTLVLDTKGRFVAALGSAGGARIIDSVAWALVGMLDEGLGPSAALRRPNLVDRNGNVELERADDLPPTAAAEAEALATALATLGHVVDRPEMNSGTHVILQRGGRLRGGADPRREGVAVGD